MKITLESTNEIRTFNGVPARIWQGETDSGIKLHCFISNIAISKNETEEAIDQFNKKLLECEAPTADYSIYPLSMNLGRVIN